MPPLERDGARVLLVGARRGGWPHALEEAGHCVREVQRGEVAVELLRREHVDVVILDADLPGLSGFDTCRRIRAFSSVGVLFLTERDALEDRLSGFDAGADDYVPLPAAPEEIDRRVRALQRRTAGSQRAPVLRGPAGLEMDVSAHRAAVGEVDLALTPKEFSVLHALLDRAGEVLSSEELSARIWGHEGYGSRNFVEAHISRLRGKLRDSGAGHILQTVRGVGYVIRENG